MLACWTVLVHDDVAALEGDGSAGREHGRVRQTLDRDVDRVALLTGGASVHDADRVRVARLAVPVAGPRPGRRAAGAAQSRDDLAVELALVVVGDELELALVGAAGLRDRVKAEVGPARADRGPAAAGHLG